MSDDLNNFISFLCAMQEHLDQRPAVQENMLAEIRENQRTVELRASNRDNGPAALRRDQIDGSQLAIDQQDRLAGFKERRLCTSQTGRLDTPAAACPLGA